MRKYLLAPFLLLTLPLFAQVPKPKLILLIAADQFRADYLQRFRTEYKGGFDLLLTKGAVFVDARLAHFPTVTAIGHSTFMTGATPSLSGIIDNAWYDRSSRKDVTSVSDESANPVGGGGGIGSSPRRLLVSTVGDELKIADDRRSRVIGISWKDRAAILPAGRMADGAFWFDADTGNFISSTYYFAQLPDWVKNFNAERGPDHYKGAEWLGQKLPPDIGPGLYATLPTSPFGNELVEALSERAIRSAQLGRRDFTDVLTISFSSNDYVGHQYGPDSPQVHDICVRLDRLLEKLFRFVDEQVGLQNVLVVFTSDHGAISVPEVNVARKMPGGRVSPEVLREAVQASLTKNYGGGQWIDGTSEFSFYLNRDLIGTKRLDEADVERTAAKALLAFPHVFRVYTRSQLVNGVATDPIAHLVLNGFNAQRSGDVFFVLDPYWIDALTGTSHGNPFSDDTHVPLVFMGSGVMAGTYYNPVEVNDIAPTIAAILRIEFPDGSVGRILSEMFQK